MVSDAVIEYRTNSTMRPISGQVLAEATSLSRMAPDVPIGISLSRGLDLGFWPTGHSVIFQNKDGQDPFEPSASALGTSLTASNNRHISRRIVDRYRIAASDIATDDA